MGWYGGYSGYIYIYGGSINGSTQKRVVYNGESQSKMDDDWG